MYDHDPEEFDVRGEQDADLVIMLVDADAGITAADEEIAEILRRTEKPVLVAANKADHITHVDNAVEFYSLGLGEVFAISAIHGLGVGTTDCKHSPRSLLPAGMLHKDGYNILLIDLRQHGDSTITNGMWAANTTEFHDVLGAWDWLVNSQKIAPQQIGLTRQPRGSRSGADPVGTAISAMGKAVDQLQGQRTRDALPHEMAALQGLIQAQQLADLPTLSVGGGIRYRTTPEHIVECDDAARADQRQGALVVGVVELLVRVDIGQIEDGTLRGERKCDRAADAAASSRDQGVFLLCCHDFHLACVRIVPGC